MKWRKILYNFTLAAIFNGLFWGNDRQNKWINKKKLSKYDDESSCKAFNVWR